MNIFVIGITVLSASVFSLFTAQVSASDELGLHYFGTIENFANYTRAVA